MKCLGIGDRNWLLSVGAGKAPHARGGIPTGYERDPVGGMQLGSENSEYNVGMDKMLTELRDWLTGRIPYPSLETSLFLMAVGAAVLWLGIRLAASS